MTEPGNRDKMEDAMLHAVTETLHGSAADESGGRPKVTLDSQLDRDLGFDSLSQAELLVNVERRFGVQMSEQLLSTAETPRDILNEVSRLRGEQPPRAAASSGADTDTTGTEDTDTGSFSVPRFETLQQALQWHAWEHPGRVYLHWVKGYDDIAPLTFGELHQGALRVANGLVRHGLEQRARVALMLPTGHDYFHAFFGALYANAIPVPLYPPMRASQLEEHLRRQAAILDNAGARVMITVPEARKLAPLMKGLVPSLEHVVTPDQLWGEVMEHRLAGTRGDDIAFLQYTSGSTGDPKGVELSHTNLFANIGAANQVLRVSQDDVFVSWLPLYHDMGLIGTCLSSLWYGMHLVIMSPLLFLSRPRYWLWAIHEFGGTLSPAPNFGFELCLKRLRDEDMAGLDLGSWREAFNGAEAVSPDTVTRFIERFRHWGFRPEAMAPVYGLAENCVALTFPEAPREPVIDRVDRNRFQEQGEAVPVDDDNALRFVCCGKALPGHEVRIVDADGRILPERREGAVQFTGPSATRGYFRNPEKTRALFDGDWLNTGDRGYLADGELYLSGRSKDLIVRAGRNLYPGEIEEAVGRLKPVRSGCVAAFATGIGEAGGEQLVVVAETRERNVRRRSQLKADIARIAQESLGISVDQVVMVKPHTIPKTSSGKLRRNDCRLRYERGELERKALPVWRQLVRLGRSSWRQQSARLWRGLGRRLYATWAWLALGLTGLPMFVLVNVLPGTGLRWKLSHRAARLLAWLTASRLRIEGAEKLWDLPAGCVIVANHASYLDALLITALIPEPVSFVAKAELMRYGVLRRLFKRLDVEPVDRSSDETSVRASRRIAERAGGRRLMFFAEGGFDAAPGLRSFHMGAFMTAVVLNRPVVPIALKGTRRKLPAGDWSPRPGPLAAVVGDPIQPEGNNWPSAVKLRDTTRRVILEHSGESDRLRS